jgi:hypothetical protein
MGDSAVCSDEVLIKDLRALQQHATWFVNFAKKVMDKTEEQQEVLTVQSKKAYSSMAVYEFLYSAFI